MALSIDVLSSYPSVQEAEVDKVLAEEIRDNEKKIVVLDDDPTGCLLYTSPSPRDTR